MNTFLKDDLYEFDLALSYASEDGFTVHKLRDYLRKKSNLKIYDYQENRKLSIFEYTPEVLKRIYSNNKVIMVMFLSENYITKDFTVYESQFACQHLMRDKRLIVIKLDKTTNAWLPDTKDYMSLYDDKKRDEREIYKIGDTILDALNLYEPESIDKLFSLIQQEIVRQLPFYNVINADEKIYISNNSHKLTIFQEDSAILICEMVSSTEINPMPLVWITCKVNEYLMICTVPELTIRTQENLSKDAAFNNLCEIINGIIK